MKSAKKLLAMLLAVIMLFSVMSTGMSAFALNLSVGNNASGATADTAVTTDDVIICVPETIYMTPGDGESVKGQYYVNNIVNNAGNVSLEKEKAKTWGAISIYAPGSTAYSFVANGVIGGIGDPIIGTANTSGTTSYENKRTEYSGGYTSNTSLALYINGKGLTHRQTALVEWKVTLYYGADDTTGTTYYAYTTLYMPARSVGAVAEARRTSNNNNEISSWITGVTGYGSRSSTLGTDRVGDDGVTADGYYRNDPLWTSVFGGGSNKTADDFVQPSESERYVHAVAVGDDQWSRSIGYRGTLVIDSSRYTNTNQVPNFRIGADILRLGDNPKDSSDFTAVWHTLGNGNETIGVEEKAEPDGWTKDFDSNRYGSTGRIVNINPSYSVEGIDGKYIHVATQVGVTYLSMLNYANAYVSVVLSTVDKSDLRALVIQATSLDESKYTEASWKGVGASVEAFHEALRDAAETLGDPAATQGAVDNALNNLKSFMNALKVSLKFDAAYNGGVFTDNEEVKEYNVVFATNNTVTLKSGFLSMFTAAKHGYEFIGWSLDPDDPSTASLTAIPGVTFGDTLYAHYAKTIAADFHYLTDLDGNTAVMTNEITVYNNEDKVLDVNVQDADNVGDYIFAGWTLDPESTEGAALGETLTGITEDAEYYATYKQNVAVVLDANGGQASAGSVEGAICYNYDLSESTGAAEITLPEDAPVKTGHGFKGWDINGKIYKPGDTLEITQTIVATAIWSVDNYTVTFNYKDADGDDVSVSFDIEYGNAATAPEVNEYYYTQNMHYKFQGWDKNFDFVAGDTVITAVYGYGIAHNNTTVGSYPTCEEAGSVTYTCRDCGYSYTYSSGALGHKYVAIDSKDATCDEDGYIVWECQNDVNHTYTEVVPATGHSYEGTVYVAPTCTEDGYYISGICSICGEDLTGKVIPALGHTWNVVTEATCEHPGLKECLGWTDEYGNHCDCDVTEVIPQLEHDYTSVVTAPTCTQDGKIVYTCSDCGHFYETVIPATGHVFATIIVPPSCTSQGYTIKTCPNCGDSEKSDFVPARGHKYVTTAVDAGCVTQGYTKHTCSVCNHSYKEDYSDVLGHDYSIETVVAAGCTTRGYVLHECARCDSYFKTDYTVATGHNHVHSNTVYPSGTMNGYDLFVCSNCGDEYKETIYADGKALICHTVYDSEGNYVPNATIVFTNVETGEQITVTTDKNGYFTYLMPEGEYSVKVTSVTHNSAEGDLFVENGVYSLNIPAVPCTECTCLCHQDNFIGRIYRIIIKLLAIFGFNCCVDSAA